MKFFPALLLAALPFFAEAQTKNILIATGLKATVFIDNASSEAKILMAGMDTLALPLAESNAPRAIKTSDYNFDGFKDLAVTTAGTQPGAVLYDLFLYHPAEKTFEPLETGEGSRCDAFTNVKLLRAENAISVTCRAEGGKPMADIFRWETPFSLTYLRSTGADPDAEKPEREPRSKKKKDDEEDSEDE